MGMPTNRWSNKDERQYEHIKESNRDRGMPERKATEIAARTVNKRRRTEGHTQNRRTMGTGNPNRPLEERTRDEVYNIAQDLEIRGRSKMTKSELVEAVRHKRGR
jgi:plasmid stabilization system protein ParE